MSAWLPYLALNNVEVGNGARATKYAAGIKTLLMTGEPCSVLGTGFTTPAADPAPWYSASVPASADFYGFYPAEWSTDGGPESIVEPVEGDFGGGVSTGTTRPPLSITVKGLLLAGSCAGLDYGRAWLTSQLDSCGECGVPMMIRAYCPSGTDPTDGLYTLYDVRVARTLSLVETPGERCCDWQLVEFELVALTPYFYTVPVTLVAPTALNPAGSDDTLVPYPTWVADTQNSGVCATIQPPSRGTDAAIITITAATGDIVGLRITKQNQPYPSKHLYPSGCLYPGRSGPPIATPNTTCPDVIEFGVIPSGATLEVNAALRRATLKLADGTTRDARDLVDTLTGWPEAKWCDPSAVVCVSVPGCGADAGATVSITRQHRHD